MIKARIPRKARGSYTTVERRPNNAPKGVLTFEQQNLVVLCPDCGVNDWYTPPEKKDVWQCNDCKKWYHIVFENGALHATWSKKRKWLAV
jgi:ribosomal protein L37AE/L43A